MKEQIALIQVAIHHITGKEVNIQPPKNSKQILQLQIMFDKAMKWSRLVNLKTVET